MKQRIKKLLVAKGYCLANFPSSISVQEIKNLAYGRTTVYGAPCRHCGAPRKGNWCSDPDCSTNPRLSLQDKPCQVL